MLIPKSTCLYRFNQGLRSDAELYSAEMQIHRTQDSTFFMNYVQHYFGTPSSQISFSPTYRIGSMKSVAGWRLRIRRSSPASFFRGP